MVCCYYSMITSCPANHDNFNNCLIVVFCRSTSMCIIFVSTDTHAVGSFSDSSSVVLGRWMRHERCRPRAGARPPRVARSLRKLRRRRRQRHHTSATAVSRLSTRTRRLHQALPVSVLSSADTQVNDTHRLYECQIENIACSVITSEEQRSRKRPMRYCVSHGCIDDIRGSSDDRQLCR